MKYLGEDHLINSSKETTPFELSIFIKILRTSPYISKNMGVTKLNLSIQILLMTHQNSSLLLLKPICSTCLFYNKEKLINYQFDYSNSSSIFMPLIPAKILQAVIRDISILVSYSADPTCGKMIQFDTSVSSGESNGNGSGVVTSNPAA